MPPYDPWMAGSGLYVSYYYFGYVMMGLIEKLSMIPNGMAYNVALAYLYALSAIGIVGLLFNLTKNYVVGFFAFAFLLLLGNLDGLRQLMHLKGGFISGFNWWNSTRIMDYENYDYTITEFPFFSFLLGDMHPHQMAIPFVLLALNIGLTFIKTEAKEMFRATVENLGFIIFAGLVLGGLWFLNSWDFPTYFFVTALCVISNKYSRDEKLESSYKDMLYTLGLILGVGIVAYLPFTVLFKSQVKGIGLVMVNTKVSDYIIIFGIMLFPVLSFITARILNWVESFRINSSKSKKRELFCPHCGAQFREGKNICGQCGYVISGDELYLGGLDVAPKKTNETASSFFKFLSDPAAHKDNRVYVYSFTAAGIALALTVYKSVIDKVNLGLTTGILTVILSVLILLLVTRTELKENQFILILVFTALFATWGTEIFRVVDGFNDNVKLRRMNTVFKFYYQAWIMLSVAAAYSFFWVNHFYLNFKKKYIRYLWNTIFGLLIACGLLYTIGGTAVRTDNFRNYMTLDGTDFLRSFEYDGRMSAYGDFQAIDWIKRNIKDTPVILEACGGSYTEYARVSSFTGLPTVIGWPWHETQWRGTGDEASRRENDVRTIYETPDVNLAETLLKKYNVKYVYMGALEKDKYAASPQGLAKFAGMGDIVYANKMDTVIYKLRD
jgi:YYY domain-containing protein